MSFTSTKIIELGSCAFRQPTADSHCRFVHGYRLIAKFWFRAKELDHNNWVVDFGGLKGLKKLLEDQFDHTTCIARTDPKLELFKKMRDAGVCDLRIMDGVGIEKFAEWCHGTADKFVRDATNMRCRCVAVEVFEHEKNSAIFSTDVSESIAVEEPTKDIDVDKPVSIAKNDNSVTRSPFANKKKAKAGTSLWPKKEKNKWMSGDSTWGF